MFTATVILVIGDHTVDAGQELNGVNADLEAFVLDDAEGQRAVSNLPSALNEAVTTTDQPLISLKDGRQESVERLEQEFSAMNTLDNSSSATSMGLPDQGPPTVILKSCVDIFHLCCSDRQGGVVYDQSRELPCVR